MILPIAIFITVISLLIILVIISSLSKKEGFLSKFLTRVSVINGFLSAFAIYITYTIFKVQTDKIYDEMSLTIADRGFLNVNKAINDSYDKCPTLVNSLYFDWQKKIISNYSENKKDQWPTCSYLSNILFQAWEDYLALTDYEEVEDPEAIAPWMAVFIQWTVSDELKKFWEVFKSNYSVTTAEFGDYLFKMTKKYNPKNPEELLYYATKIADSEKVKSIKLRHLGYDVKTEFD